MRPSPIRKAQREPGLTPTGHDARLTAPAENIVQRENALDEEAHSRTSHGDETLLCLAFDAQRGSFVKCCASEETLLSQAFISFERARTPFTYATPVHFFYWCIPR
ncbi:hypothetical protein MRX96_057128 [Rhipicephalus microplus]